MYEDGSLPVAHELYSGDTKDLKPQPPWQKGQSGNPTGRPKLTMEQKEMMKEIKTLGPKCISAMNEILDRGSAIARVRLIEVILSYIVGKPESNIKLDITSTEEKVIQSELRIAALVQTIKEGGKITDGEYGNLAAPPVSLEEPASDREYDRVSGSDEPSQQMDP